MANDVFLAQSYSTSVATFIMPATDFGRDNIPQWPDNDIAIPQGARDVLEFFYRLVDTESEEALKQWTLLFTEDGLVEIGSKRVQGHVALLGERKSSWVKVKSRKHRLHRVYVTANAGLDLLAIGSVDIECRNGARFSQEFAQNFLLQQGDDGKFHILKFQAWIVSNGMAWAYVVES